ncbi:MAG: UV DNA damage repair endonuclease UvsE [Coriobacteriia bacterium]|nr:UV DNA damage repair endonuclease UvsE [Coriobacteriia bacterium]
MTSVIRLGYAAVNTRLPSANRTFRLSRYTEERMLETAASNVDALEAIVRWNADHGIEVFRVGSGLIPFGSHPVNRHRWQRALAERLASVGAFARERGMRLSMHPGRYTVLNALSENALQASLEDLSYHTTVLELLGGEPDWRIVLHCGGAYGDKTCALSRLEQRYGALPGRVRRRLAFENDETVCTASDVLRLCARVGAPAVFDVFHHAVNPSMPDKTVREVVEAFSSTWPAEERQKIHYSDQQAGKPPGAHSEHVDVEAFARLHDDLAGLELDVVLEVKDKEQSVLDVVGRVGIR